MNIDDFKTIVEIANLDFKVTNHNKKIAEQNKRVEEIKTQRNEKEQLLSHSTEKLKESQGELKSLEAKIFEVEKKLSQGEDRLTIVTSEKQLNATQTEINTGKILKESLEGQALELMEKIDFYQDENSTSKEFLDGSVSTLEEIENEVKDQVAKETKEIENLNKRIEALLETCPPLLKTPFLASRKKFKDDFSVAWAEDGVCNRCQYAVSKNDQQNINRAINVEVCMSCERILIPKSAVS